MAGKNPRPATVEDYDDELHQPIPDSSREANTGAKLASLRLDPRFHEPIDGASDSGYSSRTAATINSTQSGPSGGRSPPGPLKQLDGPNRDIIRKSSRKERKEKDRRPAREEKMMGYSHHAPVVQSKPPRRRDSIRQSRPETYYEGGYQYHPSLPSTPVEPRSMDLPYAYNFRPPMPDGPPMQPPMSRYDADVQYHSSRSNRPTRTQSYHYHQERPMSWAMTHGGYPSSPVYSQFERGPPPSWPNPHGYGSSPYGSGSYYAPTEYMPEYGMEHRERSESRTRPPSRARRASIYGQPPPPPVHHGDEFFDWEEEEPEEYYNPRVEKPRGRGSIKPSREMRGYEEDEDVALMPPPPPRRKPALQIHQEPKRPEPRKSATSTAVPSRRRQSLAMEPDFDDMPPPPPDYPSRRISKELPMDRSQSLRRSKRSTSYNESNSGAARVAVNNSLRRRPQQYYYPESGGGLEDAESEAEQYIARRSGRVPADELPASEETLVAKMAAGPSSEGSQSRSGSSRGSNGAYKPADEAGLMTLMMNGMTIGINEQTFRGKQIKIRTGDEGAASLNISDGTSKPRPKKYISGVGSSYSDNATTVPRRLEDRQERQDRRTREERRTERAAHRSSRSSYRV